MIKYFDKGKKDICILYQLLVYERSAIYRFLARNLVTVY